MVVLIFLVILGLTFENLTRVTEDSLPLGNSTIQILIFRPVERDPKVFSAIFRQSKFNIESSISSAILRVRGPSFRQWPTLVHICCSLQLRDKWRRLKFFPFSDGQTHSSMNHKKQVGSMNHKMQVGSMNHK